MSTTTTHRHSATAPPPPTIALPPRPSLDSFFSGSGGISPGPMTLVSSFFAEDSPSFSQLLAGAMASPLAFPPPPQPSKEPSHYGLHRHHGADDDGSHSHKNVVEINGGGGGGGGGFKQSRPMNMVVARSPLFTVPPGLSPSGFLNSPGFFSPQSPFGISHQQALAQVTAQAELAQPHMQMQNDYQPSAIAATSELSEHNQPFNQNGAEDNNLALYVSETGSVKQETSEITNVVDKKFQQPSLAIDKPADDGYNWRKYGQKQVKGSEYPRSYYKCTHLNCPVKKKVERAIDGHITEIIYKGQHRHEKTQANRRSKDNYDSNENAAIIQRNSESNSQGWVGNSNSSGEILLDCSMLDSDQTLNQGAPKLPGLSESEDVSGVNIQEEDGNDGEPNPKGRNTNPGVSEVHQRTVTEAKIIVQTRSEVDLLDDGYRWRKYGQKVVKGNPHPRSYYKCTSAGCNVRKHIERASTDPKAVITTYEGKHNHDVPGSRNSTQNITTNITSIPLKPHNLVHEKHPLLKDMDFGNSDQRPIHLRLKEEKIAV